MLLQLGLQYFWCNMQKSNHFQPIQVFDLSLPQNLALCAFNAGVALNNMSCEVQTPKSTNCRHKKTMNDETPFSYFEIDTICL